MATSYVYALYCTCHPDSGPRYVGSTTRTPRERLREHLKPYWLESAKYPVSRWVSKHGRDNIRIYTLEECDSTVLDDREVHWISEFRSRFVDLLNISDGGSGVRSRVPTEEERLNISRKLKDYYSTHENPFQGKKHSPATRAVMSAKATGRRLSPEARAKVSEAVRNRKVKPETLSKMSVLNKGELNPSAKIDSEAASQIWTMLCSSKSKTPIADTSKELGISRHIVANIKNGLSWRHVTGLENPYGRLP